MCPTPRNNCNHGADSPEMGRNGPGDLQGFVRMLIRRVASREDPQQVENSLDILIRLGSQMASASLIVSNHGIPAIVQIMQHQDSTDSMKVNACQVLSSLVCTCCHNDATVESHCSAVVEAGAVEACVQNLTLESNSVEVHRANCNLLSQIAEKKNSIVKDRGGIEAIVSALQHHVADAGIQIAGIHALMHVSFCETSDVPIQQAGGVEAVAEGMGGHLSNPAVQKFGCWFMRSMACSNDDAIKSSMPASGAIERVLDAMQEHPAAPELQTMACAALWNISAFTTNRRVIFELGGIQIVLDAMMNHESNAAVQEHATGVLWNLATDDEDLRVAITEAGGIELVVKAMETHSDNSGIDKEGTGALLRLAKAKDRRVRLALTQTGAIPALRSVHRKYNLPLHEMMQNMTWERSQMLEACENALTKLGVVEVTVLGDDEYDADNEQDEGPLESPPFDIGNLLSVTDLATSAPGWYRARPFHVDYERSYKCRQETGQDFLIIGTAPVVGQHICLRIMLPYGGRGHLYGSVTEVGPLATDEELTNSASAKYGKECVCSSPSCRIRHGTREELLSACGTLHGHEVTAIMSLHTGSRFEMERKLRFGPLPKFFRDENSRYAMKLRFNDSNMQWEVVNIAFATNEASDGNGACGFCGQPATLRCSRCKSVVYCSKKHQKKAWSSHKMVCNGDKD